MNQERRLSDAAGEPGMRTAVALLAVERRRQLALVTLRGATAKPPP